MPEFGAARTPGGSQEREPGRALGSLIMRSDADRGALLSTQAGILGALLAGRLLAPLLGGAPAQGFFSLGAALVSLLGAVVLVGLVNLLRRGRIR